MQNKKLLTFLLIILLVVAVLFVFGYLRNLQIDETNNQTLTNDESSGTSINNQQEPFEDQPQGAKPSSQTNLSADEKAALAASSGESAVDVNQQVVLATKVAKEMGSINVAGCQLDPAVLKVKYKTNFTLKNSGSDEVSVVFYADNKAHLVPALGEVSVKADFGKQGAGLFGYYCRAGSNVYQGLVLLYNP